MADEATIVRSLKRALTSGDRPNCEGDFNSLVFRLELLTDLFRSKDAFAHALPGDENTVDFGPLPGLVRVQVDDAGVGCVPP